MEKLRISALDRGLAAIAAAVQIAGTTVAAAHGRDGGATTITAGGYALLLVGPLALLARRRWPRGVLAVTFAATLAYSLLGEPHGPIFAALVIAWVSAVVEGHRRVAWAFLVGGYVALLWLPSAVGTQHAPSLSASVGVAAWLLLLAAIAERIVTRRERAIERERAREADAQRRVGEERLRIARELHDVLAHNVSLINVQAGVALHLIDERPEQARTALAAIKQASGETLREMRAVLGTLRQVDEELPRSPAPSLARLDELLERVERAGTPVRADVHGLDRPLPAAVDLAAYRIVQEALTNVGRHAGEATAEVRVRRRDGELVVQVDDDGVGAASGTNGDSGIQRASSSPSGLRPRAQAGTGGHGIPGMRERARALGGELEAGPRREGGFRVRARLPVVDA